MKKLLLSLLCAMCVWAVNAQTHYLRISQLDGTVTEFQVSTIDSINFVTSPADPFNGHDYVDLELPSGTLWATCNVGAKKPEEAGYYLAWGETKPKLDSEGNYLDYTWSTYIFGAHDSLTKYTENDNKVVLSSIDDAATVNWGGNWRMPTNDEIDELWRECNWKDTTINGVTVYKISSKTEGNTAYIYLPAAGFRDTQFWNKGRIGYYWSASRIEWKAIEAAQLGNRSSASEERYYGCTVRPVCSPAK